MPPRCYRIIKESKFTYSQLGKALENQTQGVEEHGKRQVWALKSLGSPGKESPSINSFISEKIVNLEIMIEKKYTEGQEQKIARTKMLSIQN